MAHKRTQVTEVLLTPGIKHPQNLLEHTTHTHFILLEVVLANFRSEKKMHRGKSTYEQQKAFHTQ